jgi:hypothetical protein
VKTLNVHVCNLGRKKKGHPILIQYCTHIKIYAAVSIKKRYDKIRYLFTTIGSSLGGSGPFRRTVIYVTRQDTDHRTHKINLGDKSAMYIRVNFTDGT